MISEPKEYFIKQKLHRSRQEGGIAEDVEDIFGGGDEEGLSLFDMNAVDMRFSPEADYYDESVGPPSRTTGIERQEKRHDMPDAKNIIKAPKGRFVNCELPLMRSIFPTR